jgi:RecA-family ATPase
MFKHITELEDKSPVWLVENLIQKNVINMVYGEPKSLKTHAMICLAFHIGSGTPIANRKVNQAVVGYIACEGFESIKQRCKPLEQKHWANAKLVNFSRTVIDLLDADSCRRVAKQAKEYGIDLIIVDTLQSALSNGDLNSTNQVLKILHNIRLYWLSEGLTALLVHHSGKDLSKGMNGSNVFNGEATMVIKNHKNRLEVTHARNCSDSDNVIEYSFFNHDEKGSWIEFSDGSPSLSPHQSEILKFSEGFYSPINRKPFRKAWFDALGHKPNNNDRNKFNRAFDYLVKSGYLKELVEDGSAN